MTKFSDFYSFDQFSMLMKGFEEAKYEKKGFNLFFEQRVIIAKSIIRFIEEKAKKGELSSPANAETHEASFLTAWNNLVKGEMKGWDEPLLERAFSGIPMFRLGLLKDENPEYDSASLYQEFTDSIDRGDLDIYEINSDCSCRHCEKRVFASSSGWKLSLHEFDMQAREYKPMKACVEKVEQEVEVEFKTGELLIADWFRIEAFTEKVRYNKDHSDTSINAALGCIKSTQHAAKHGFVTVHVGNSCPQIYQKGDSFVFGHAPYSDDGDSEDDEESVPGYENKGYVCTDLWNVTIIDKARLIEIVAETKGGEAKNIVEEYLLENSFTTAKVEPGMYKVTFNPFVESFECRTEGDQPVNMSTFLTVKKSDMKLKRKP